MKFNDFSEHIMSKIHLLWKIQKWIVQKNFWSVQVHKLYLEEVTIERIHTLTEQGFIFSTCFIPMFLQITLSISFFKILYVNTFFIETDPAAAIK